MGMTKKDMYNENPLIDMRTHIHGETAIKPYYYYRCGVLHVRYTVDRAIELTPSESAKLKVDMTTGDKQEVLAKAWNFFELTAEKSVIEDGIALIDKRLKGAENNDIQ
jgi:hypothetical protein